ncbi:MAG: T9SS type A sorting domain-containing protein [Bacteroidetes bacterium]|nr:T9SS type A sorting domain-containing protein [Bacteroidota bacterium]
MKTKLFNLSILFISMTGFGQNLFQDDFLMYTTGADLHNQGTWTHNSSLPGGLGAAIGAIPNNADVLSSAVSYQDYGISTNSVAISPDSDGVGTPFTAVTDGDVYVAFVLNLSAAQANNNSDFFRVMSGANLNTTFRLYAINTGLSYNLAICKGANGNPLATSALSYGYNQDHLVVIKYSQLAGANDDIVSLYVDPVYLNGEPVSPSAITNTGADQSGNIDRLVFRMNWTNGMPTGKAGLVSVAKTWEELTFIPLATEQFNSATFYVNALHAATGKIVIDAQTDVPQANLRIIGMNGQIVAQKTTALTTGSNELSINALSTGVYMFEISQASGQRFVQKIMVR